MVPFQQGTVRGFLHHPENPPQQGIVITHGAGGNCTAPLLVAVANAFANAGTLVLRCDLPFRQRRAFGPPTPAMGQQDRAGLRDAVNIVRTMVSGPVMLGGQSYGGRQATMLEAEDPGVSNGLLLFSYPLHPPGKPAQRKTAHFASLRTRALFLQGTKDPFGTIEEMRSALQLITPPTQLVAIEGAGHDLARGKFNIDALLLQNARALFS